MKTKIQTLLESITAGFILLTVLPVHAQWGRVYVKADMGGTVVTDTELKEFLGPVVRDSAVEFDPGFRFGMVMGYEATDWFSAEFETGFTYNTISSITGAFYEDVSYSNVPFLFNARLQWPNRSRLTPYCGAGVGFTSALLEADPLTIGDVTLYGSEAAFAFAWQAFAGVRYDINENMGVSVEFHYFWAGETEWDVDVTYGTFSNEVKFGDTQTFAASIAFQYRF